MQNFRLKISCFCEYFYHVYMLHLVGDQRASKSKVAVYLVVFFAVRLVFPGSASDKRRFVNINICMVMLPRV